MKCIKCNGKKCAECNGTGLPSLEQLVLTRQMFCNFTCFGFLQKTREDDLVLLSIGETAIGDIVTVDQQNYRVTWTQFAEVYWVSNVELMIQNETR